MAKSARGKERRSREKPAGARRASRGGARAGETPADLPFGVANAVFGGAGLLVVILGYVLLAQGSITAAPLLLALGYAVLLPVAIVK